MRFNELICLPLDCKKFLNKFKKKPKNIETLKELYELLISIDEGKEKNKIEVDEQTAKDAKIALQRMMELS